MLNQPLRGQDQDQEKVNLIKIAYLVNFMRLTSWKDLSKDPKEPPFSLTVIGGQEMIQLLEHAFEDGKFNGRKVQINHLPVDALHDKTSSDKNLKILSNSHLIYMHNTGQDELQAFHREDIEMDYLLVGNMPEFAENGGMIGLQQQQSGISFTVNIKQIRKSSIHVSSKLLRLGVKVRTKNKS
ncbi:MAG TPA: hypothetical protein DCM28_03535 [Phycisphaerales bacterium]|nr:hypothetical protein [Phycisphaerales bacterium]|tara:strand:- start:21 stop:569 length:549 start_codon:yes stop_codon:yes gene_type:complete